ncbi:MAG: hypothetical protein MJZ81_07720 [Bacteroidales bacterium]|nr:hypothetical protein [Bacteroidales bacterium]
MVEFIARYWLQWLFGLVAAGFGLMYRNLAKRLHQEQEKRKALEDGMLALLRNGIVDGYNRCQEKGCCPIYVRENLTKMYTAYHNLGGNGVITGLMDDIKKMPVSPAGGK